MDYDEQKRMQTRTCHWLSRALVTPLCLDSEASR